MLASRLSVPQRRDHEIDRPRLVEQFSGSVDRPVTVVSAPPGAGKTYAAAAWIRSGRAPGRTAWLTVDEGDDAPGIFWAYVIESLRFHGVPLGNDVQPPARPDAVDRSLLARLAAQLAELSRPVILVLDQIESAGSSAVAAGLDFVLRHAGLNLRLVITTRADPVLPLHRHRLGGELAEIGRDELAFTHEEATALLTRHLSGGSAGRPPARKLSAEAVSILLRRTEGWAGGLRLYALALQEVDDPERFVREHCLSEDVVADYLRAEVLDTLPEATRDLLQRVSVLKRIHPELADELTGRHDAGAILRDLAKSNAFIECIENTGRWYRCHPMFAGALRDQLNLHQPGIEPELHRRAARWLAAAGHLTDCIGHAAVVEDWELAATQIVQHLAVAGLLSGREAHPLAARFAKMPRDQPRSPAVALVAAALAASEPDARQGAAQLDLAEQLTDQLPPELQLPYRLGIAVVRVAIARLLGDVQAAQAAAKAAGTLTSQLPPERLAERPDLPTVVLANLAATQLWAGDLDQADQTLRQAVEASVAPGLETARQGCLGHLALLHLLRGRLRRANLYALEAAGLAERSGTPTGHHSGAGRTALAAIAFESNDIKAAGGHLRDAAMTSDARQDPLVVVEIAILQSRIDRAAGRYGAALDTLRRAAEWSRQHGNPRWLMNCLAADQVRVQLSTRDIAAAEDQVAHMTPGPVRSVSSARIHLAAGRPAAALEAIAGIGLVPTAPAAGESDPEVGIPVHLLRAQAAVAAHDEPGARQAVVLAYELARPDGCRRPFLEAGLWLRQLLSRHPDLIHVRRWLVNDVPAAADDREREREHAAGPAGVGTTGDEHAADIVESLSQREREVLRLLAQGFTAQDISKELYVSVNTVKTHLKGIYRKLSASRRGEAVRYARQLHLI